MDESVASYRTLSYGGSKYVVRWTEQAICFGVHCRHDNSIRGSIHWSCMYSHAMPCPCPFLRQLALATSEVSDLRHFGNKRPAMTGPSGDSKVHF